MSKTSLAGRDLRRVVGLVCCVVALAGARASALTISPTGQYLATTPSLQMALPSNSQSIVCSGGSSKTMRLMADGTGTVDSLLSSSCSNEVLGANAVHIYLDSTWTVRTTLRTTGLNPTVSLTYTIPSPGLEVNSDYCTFWLQGTVTKTATLTSLLPGSAQYFAITASTLRIANNDGLLLCMFFPVGLAASAAGTLFLTRPMTISG